MLDNRLIFLVAAYAFVIGINLELTESAGELISFPVKEPQCSCIFTTCTCCQGFRVNPLDFEKNLCLEFKLYILAGKVDLKIKLDNTTIAEFTLDPKNPPTYCIPISLPVPVAMCLKLHDLKLVGQTGIQVCSTFYISYESDKVFNSTLPCVKLSPSGVEMTRR